MVQYLDLLRRVWKRDQFQAARTGTGTYSACGAQMRFDLRQDFSLLTTKQLLPKSTQLNPHSNEAIS